AALGMMADGRAVVSRVAVVDALSVGPKTVAGITVSILDGSSGEGYDGLLGMNFLKEFSYRVDFRRGFIEWGG
ncbi:MAG TPA: aspartyl protease family protein, partial [Verrucomicrobiae bacterium]|nr:aspartyl protease family protein [Verrucomicrobiae bacterium]